MKQLYSPFFAFIFLFLNSISNATDKITVVTMKTSMGDIVIALNAEKAPISVANFLKYTEDGFYDHTIFHRVINGFMIQGGGMDENMHKKPIGDAIRNEADNGLKNNRGTLAMARTGNPHSATAQFFINLIDNDYLNFSAKNNRGWGYAVFGEVIEGLDVVDKMAEVLTGTKNGHRNVPDENIVILSVSVNKPQIMKKPEKKAPQIIEVKPQAEHSDIKIIESTSDIQVH